MFKDVGLELTQARINAKLTPAELSTKAKIDQATIHKIENGQCGDIDIGVLTTICSALNVGCKITLTPKKGKSKT